MPHSYIPHLLEENCSDVSLALDTSFDNDAALSAITLPNEDSAPPPDKTQ